MILIPPHVSLLQEISSLHYDGQCQLIDQFVDREKEASVVVYSCVNSNWLTKERLQRVLDEFHVELRGGDELQSLEHIGVRSRGGILDKQEAERVETATGYRLHCYAEDYHRVPVD